MSFEPVTIVLAGKPMGKERVKPNAFANLTHMYTPERTVTYESRFAYEAQHVMAGKPLLTGELLLDIAVFMPIPDSKPKRWKEAALRHEVRPAKKPDWDNFGKIIDALNMQVWVDDAQIVRGLVDKFYSERPMMCMLIRPVSTGDRRIPAWTERHQMIQPRGLFQA